MSLLDFILGGPSGSGGTQKQKTQTQATSSGTKDTLQGEVSGSSTTGSSAATSQQRQTQTGVTTLYTPGQQAVLNNTINKAAGVNNIYSPNTAALVGQLGGYANNLQDYMSNFGNDTQGIIDATTKAANLNYAETEGSQINQYASQVGSPDNAIVQLLKAKGARDLATSVGAVNADTLLKSRDQFKDISSVVGGAISNAVGASGQLDQGTTLALNNVLNSLAAARGGTTVSTGDVLGSTASTSQTQEDKLVQDLIESASTSTALDTSSGTAKGTTTDTGSLLNFLNLFTGGSSLLGSRTAAA